MQIQNYHLTYSTSIHPAKGWDDVLDTIDYYVLALKKRLSPDAPFGVGLRLSNQEACELLQGKHLARFRHFLDDSGLYVFTLNGTVYGDAHGQALKEKIHAPDWRSEDRVHYTLRLVKILAALLPDHASEGGITTGPLSYRAWVTPCSAEACRLITWNLVQVAAEMARLHAEGGPLLHLDIEPGPGGLLQTSTDTVMFFEKWVLIEGAALLADLLDVSAARAQDILRNHLRVCLDTGHSAVLYEDPAEVLLRYHSAGIRLGKVQISAAIHLPLPTSAAERDELRLSLEYFQDSGHLHPVTQRSINGSLKTYLDLPEALPHFYDREALEWRVGVHMPVFLEQLAGFRSTQNSILQTLGLLHENGMVRHLEIETHGWDLLSDELRFDLLGSIERELRWVMSSLHACEMKAAR